jgi:hypothetical protein
MARDRSSTHKELTHLDPFPLMLRSHLRNDYARSPKVADVGICCALKVLIKMRAYTFATMSVPKSVRLVLIPLVLIACGIAQVETGAATKDGGESFPTSDGGTDAVTSDAAVTVQPCIGETPTCSAWNTRRSCVLQGAANVWIDEVCSAGCFAGACSASACTDECALGTSAIGGVCALWDMATGAKTEVNPVAALADRSRDYDRILRERDLPEGQVMNAIYTDDGLTSFEFYAGAGDAAIWTGSALASQAFRLRATESPDAAAQVRALVAALHRDFAVTGSPGSLARFAMPSSLNIQTDNKYKKPDYCTAGRTHCNVAYDGKNYEWEGGISRDQYTGVMLGYALAYDATHDESVRAIIRSDVLSVAEELAKKRTMSVGLKLNNLPAVSRNVTFENVILIPAEFVNGRVQFDVNTAGLDDSGIHGIREFVTDYNVLTSDTLAITRSVPRPSSAMMLHAFFSLALHVSKQAEPARYGALKAYVDANAPKWLSVAEGWSFDSNCGKAYYANHIAYIMAYLGATLEEDPARKVRSQALLDGRLYPAVRDHKQAYFTYLWSGARNAAPSVETIAANRELAGFPVGPRVHISRDASVRYPRDPICTDDFGQPVADTRAASKIAVLPADRVVEDFMWQRSPWRVKDTGSNRQVFPGVDYLAAYWAARAHKLIEDDRPGTCTRRLP